MLDAEKQNSNLSTDTEVSRSSLQDNIKKVEEYRVYTEGNSVARFYHENHIKQTYNLVQEKKQRFLGSGGKYKYSIMECAKKLNEIVDESDPDISKSQIYHLVQTGEMARKYYPELRWLHLIGFLHDLGKILSHKDLFGEPQWCVVGDTFPVGCAFDEKNVHSKFFGENPDTSNPKYNTKLGVYTQNCGFDNVQFSWSHDEYMYQILKKSGCTIPEPGLYIIRYHSFYAWHTYQAYNHLASDYDRDMLKYLKMFQKCDLYSKIDEEINFDKALPYYENLIKEFIPNDSEIMW